MADADHRDPTTGGELIATFDFDTEAGNREEAAALAISHCQLTMAANGTPEGFLDICQGLPRCASTPAASPDCLWCDKYFLTLATAEKLSGPGSA
jgi:hypothetical protein